MSHVLICGANGGIGAAMARQVLKDERVEYCFLTHRPLADLTALKDIASDSRVHLIELEVTNESSYVRLKEHIQEKTDELDQCINCIGVLQDEHTRPERKIDDFDPASLTYSIEVNTTPSLLLFKHLESLLRNAKSPIFAAVSAKVGSIGDNRMGGWHSYRVSKAALNMALQNIAIEFNRRNKNSICVSLHPGTTETKLSAPFMSTARKRYKIHTAQETAENLHAVIGRLNPKGGTARFLAYDGTELPW